jgi:Flp pilus assembly protein TadG
MRITSLMSRKGSEGRLPGGTRSDRGAEAVEFALIVTLLFLLLFGIMQFGYTFFEYNEVVAAAREGARSASIGKTDAEVRQRTIDASPGLVATSLTVTIVKSTDSARVTVSYPRTQLVPLPMVVLPAVIAATAEMKME